MASSTLDEYFASVPVESLERLNEIRRILLNEFVGGLEMISYGIPTIKHGKAVVHFAGYKSHIGFYPGSKVIADFDLRLKGYKRAKGSVQFPLNVPLPEKLISEMAKSVIGNLE